MISAVMPTYSRAPLNFVKGEGSWLIEADGRRFLDFGSGIAVNALGHAHPALVTRLKQQAETLWHVSNLYYISEQQELADKLVDLSFADTVFFTNSGTESCELAIKMVRKYWYERGHPEKVQIIAFEGSFHGRSSAGIAAAGAEKLIEGFGPLIPGFIQVEWANHERVRSSIKENTAAIIIEPLQGEGGIRLLPDDCLRGLRRLCDEKGILLILDEVQCGVGRTGKLFAHEWSGVTPDIMMVAKGIGGGFPIGAVLATENAALGMTAGTHGSTYGGNPLACAVACSVVEHIADPTFLNEVRFKSALLMQGLQSLVTTHREIFEEVRGYGLMLGLKCKLQNTEVLAACYTEELITVPASDNVLRLLPPLNISEQEIRQAILRLHNAARSCKKNLKKAT